MTDLQITILLVTALVHIKEIAKTLEAPQGENDDNGRAKRRIIGIAEHSLDVAVGTKLIQSEKEEL